MNPIAILLIVFFVTLLLGVPFVWSLLLASVASVCLIDGFPLMTIASKMYNGGAKYTLLAIFFFMLAGAIMQHGGISRRLIDFAKALVGHLRGGLSIVVLLVCMLFAALSGSSIATTAAIGAMLYPELVKERYPEGYAAALPVVGGDIRNCYSAKYSICCIWFYYWNICIKASYVRCDSGNYGRYVYVHLCIFLRKKAQYSKI